MRVSEAQVLLSKIAAGEQTEASSAELVEALLGSDLIHEPPDRAKERDQLTELQARLARASDEASRRGLRSQILALSEALAMSSRVAIVSVPAGGAPYRSASSATERRFVLTARGRAFLSDLEPRAERAAELTIDAFEEHMELLRRTLEARGERAGRLAATLASISREPSAAAWRSAAIGLAACREDDDEIVRVFRALLEEMGERRAPWTADQLVSAAECMCLVAPRLADVEPAAWSRALLDRRDEMIRTLGSPEEALRAAVVLTAVPPGARAEVLDRARTLAERARPLPLATAVVCVATGAATAGNFDREVTEGASALASALSERAAALEAIALGLATGGDVRETALRIRAHHGQLSRFTSAASLPVAALLCWIDAPTSETFDDLRLAGAIVQTHRLAVDAAETSASAVKLLLLTALLAEGDEGDAEEKLALGARLHARIAGLGMGTLATLTPMLVGATAAYVQPMLDAAAIWSAAQRQMQGYSHTSWGGNHYYG